MDKSSIQAKFSADYVPLLLLGVGCCLPIGATVLDLLRHGLPFTLASVLAVQTTQPLHWFIDSIPLLVFFLAQVSAQAKRHSTSSRPNTQGEANGMTATKLTQAVTELKAELAKQRKVEETLRASEEFYRTLVENTNDGIATISLDGTLTSVNRGFELMLGRIREEIVGKHYSTILSISSLGLIEDRIRRFQAGEKLPSVFEFELLHHNGTVVPIEARTRAITDKNSTAIGFQGIYRDTTKRGGGKKKSAASQASAPMLETGTILGTTAGTADAEVLPWMQSSSQSNSNTTTHYPAGYSPLSRSTAPPASGTLDTYSSPSPVAQEIPPAEPSVVSASQSPPALPGVEAPPPQFRFAEAANDSSPPRSLAAASPEQEAHSQFALVTDRPKKEERQAKVVPFPTVSTQGPAISFPPQLGSPASQHMLNLDEALNRVDGDRELLREMAGVFLEEYPLLLVTMQDALSHGNAQTLTFAVHTLKGSVANFAATNAFEAALKLEKIGRQGNLTQAKNALAELEAELARLAPLLTTLKMEAAA